MISETAKRNHEELFSNHESTLKDTDPELIEVFDNFAFDEVVSYGNLDKKTRLKVILSTLIASQTLSEYKVMLSGALNIGVTPVEVKEIVYQAVPYCGIAKVIDFIHATNDVLMSRRVELPLERQSTTSPETRFEKGLAVQKAVFGEMIDTMYEESPEDELHVQEYLSDNCFGDYYTRTGLDIKTRELLTFSMILSMGGCEPQLKAHVQGNVNVGNDKETLLSGLYDPPWRSPAVTRGGSSPCAQPSCTEPATSESRMSPTRPSSIRPVQSYASRGPVSAAATSGRTGRWNRARRAAGWVTRPSA